MSRLCILPHRATEVSDEVPYPVYPMSACRSPEEARDLVTDILTSQGMQRRAIKGRVVLSRAGRDNA